MIFIILRTSSSFQIFLRPSLIISYLTVFFLRQQQQYLESKFSISQNSFHLWLKIFRLYKSSFSCSSGSNSSNLQSSTFRSLAEYNFFIILFSRLKVQKSFAKKFDRTLHRLRNPPNIAKKEKKEILLTVCFSNFQSQINS